MKGSTAAIVRAKAPYSGLSMKRQEMPISAGLIANGRMIRVRSMVCPKPARRSRIARPSAARIVRRHVDERRTWR